jgi:hypothetical protein
LLLLALGGVCGAWLMIQSLASLSQRASGSVLGVPVSAAKQPGLWAHVQGWRSSRVREFLITS